MSEDASYVELSPVTDKHAIPCSALAAPELLMVLGALVMVGANTNVQLWPIGLLELIAGRYALQWAMCVLALFLRSTFTKQPLCLFGPRESRHWLLLRGVVYYAFIWLWWATLRLVPVGNAVTVVKFECFVTGIGSHFLFGERLTLRWWACGITALFGVDLVTQPPFLFGGNSTASSSSLGIFLNMLTPLFSGSLALFIKLAPGANFMEVQHATDFVSGVLCSPVLLLFFGKPSELLLPHVQEGIVSVALLGITALCLFTASYQGGSAGRLSLLSYVEVPASYLVQVFVFGGSMDLKALCGTVLIIGAAVGVALQRLK